MTSEICNNFCTWECQSVCFTDTEGKLKEIDEMQISRLHYIYIIHSFQRILSYPKIKPKKRERLQSPTQAKALLTYSSSPHPLLT